MKTGLGERLLMGVDRMLDRLPDPRPWAILGYFASLFAVAVYALCGGFV
jgi:hypothetical protein